MAYRTQQEHASSHVTDLSCFTETDGVVTTTMMDLPGYRIEQVLGTVYGITVRSRNIGASLAMGLKSQLVHVHALLVPQRFHRQGGRRVQEEGGNAVIALRFDTGELGGFAQCAAYGTACRVIKIDASVANPPQLR